MRINRSIGVCVFYAGLSSGHCVQYITIQVYCEEAILEHLRGKFVICLSRCSLCVCENTTFHNSQSEAGDRSADPQKRKFCPGTVAIQRNRKHDPAEWIGVVLMIIIITLARRRRRPESWSRLLLLLLIPSMFRD